MHAKAIYNLSILYFLAFLSLSINCFNEEYEIHESRQSLPIGWKSNLYPNQDFILPFKIAIKQNNIDKMYDYIMQISNPSSSQYGNHWSLKEVRETFKPSKESIEAILKWLTEFGISSEKITLSGSWLTFNLTIKEAEKLLKTEYLIWSNKQTSKSSVGISQNYSLPTHIRPHIDFILPTLHFDMQFDISNHPNHQKRTQNPISSSPRLILIENPEEIHDSIDQCDQYLVPACLRALYGIPILPNTTKTNSKNSFSIIGFAPQGGYYLSDLKTFFANHSIDQKYKKPKVISIDGGDLQHSSTSLEDNIETSLDLQYSMILLNPIQVTLFQMGDKIESGTFNNFLDAFDSTYCDGDDPLNDKIYPDPIKGGYKGKKACGSNQLSKVISASYTYNEADFSPSYEKRQCNEFGKLALLGTTFIISMADHGVGGVKKECINPKTGKYNDGKSGTFNPSFPASCPFVLSVGATQILKGKDAFQPESTCSDFVVTGGGFSNVFPLPDYQKQSVKEYFKNHKPSFSSQQYNDSQQTRGYPDVSANGANYVTVIKGKVYQVWGSSASTPVIASIFTLINEARFNAGKGPVGFVNPALYANPSMFNDITKGNNPGCGTKGFSATKDWDPISGLGTPNFSKMLDYFLNL